MTKSDTLRIILTGVSCAGVAGTMVATHFNTIKAKEIMEMNHPGEIISKKQEFKETWKYYIPSMIAGAVTIASIIVNHKIGAKELAALAASGGVTFASLTKYREKVREVCGDDAVVEIDKRMAHDAEKGIIHAVLPDIYIDGLIDSMNDPEQPGDLLFYDLMTDTWFRSSLAQVYNARYHLNRNFGMGAPASVYDWLLFLGVADKMPYAAEKWSKYGWGMGLLEDGITSIDIAVAESKELADGGETYYILAPVFSPKEFTEDDL